MSLTTQEEGNKALVLRLIDEGFSRGKLSVVDEVVSPDAKEYQRGNRDGPEGTKEVINTLRTWFPDFSMHTEDIVASGDKVWARFRATGTNLGSIMKMPPTGRKMDITVIDIVRVKDGKIVEHWGVPDQLGMMLQTGLFPRP